MVEEKVQAGIDISKIWFDDDVIELKVCVTHSTSSFSNQVYVGHRAFSDAISGLEAFKDKIYGGLFDLRLGEFGSEYANGAFHARFHFPSPGRLFISCEQESDFVKFAQKSVAGSARLFLQTEPALLDRFISELRAIAEGKSTRAWLEALP